MKEERIKKEKVNDFKILLEKIAKKDSSTIQVFFNEVAIYMFENLQICAGNDVYTFAEVEFYYHDDKSFNNEVYNCTYPRNRRCGEFFWHYSGMDICFNCDLSLTGKMYFGGILIRCLEKHGEEEGIIAGPMRCSCEVMNSCNSNMIGPCLADIDEKYKPKGKLLSTIRYGVKDEEQNEQNMLCFCYYLDLASWTRERNNVLSMINNNTKYRFDKIKKESYNSCPNRRKIREKIISNTVHYYR